MVQNTPKISQISDQNEAKSSLNGTMWTSGGPWGAPVAPRYLKKSTFWTLSGSFGPPLGAPWRHLDPLGGHFGDVCVSKIVFFYHVMSRLTFCLILECFLEYVGSILGVFWVELGFQIAVDLEKSSYAQT